MRDVGVFSPIGLGWRRSRKKDIRYEDSTFDLIGKPRFEKKVQSSNTGSCYVGGVESYSESIDEKLMAQFFFSPERKIVTDS